MNVYENRYGNECKTAIVTEAEGLGFCIASAHLTGSFINGILSVFQEEGGLGDRRQ